MNEHDDLLARLDKEQTHTECEDCWYSCPKCAEGCCNEAEGDECTCGADDENALRRDAAAAIRDLTAKLEAERGNIETLKGAALFSKSEAERYHNLYEAERKAREIDKQIAAETVRGWMLAASKAESQLVAEKQSHRQTIEDWSAETTAFESRLAAVFELTKELAARIAEQHPFMGSQIAAAIRALAPEESVASRAFPYGEEFITKESK